MNTTPLALARARDEAQPGDRDIARLLAKRSIVGDSGCSLQKSLSGRISERVACDTALPELE